MAYLGYLDINPDVAGKYRFPERTSEEEITSFNLQSARIDPGTPPSPLELRRAIHRMEQLMAPARWEIPSDFLQPTHILRVLTHISDTAGDKSPGAIFKRSGYSTNADVFNKVGLEGLARMVIERIVALCKATDEEARYMSDPAQISIKMEPHKKAKADEGRWRCIWGISLIDQAIDRLLYQNMSDAAILSHEKIPCKPGMSFGNGGTDKFVRQHDDGSDRWRSFDARSYDLSVPGWRLEAQAEVEKRLLITQGPARDRWELLAHKRNIATNYGSLVFSNGAVLEITQPMIQRSGHFLTIYRNSMGATLLKVLWDVRRQLPTTPNSVVAMGDDTVAKDLEDPKQPERGAEPFLEFIKEMGSEFTEESKPGKFPAQNFCSREFRQVFGRWVPIPLNWDKVTFKLANVEKRKIDTVGDALQSLCGEYAFHPNFSLLYAKLQEHFPEKAFSIAHFQELVTGFE